MAPGCFYTRLTIHAMQCIPLVTSSPQTAAVLPTRIDPALHKTSSEAIKSSLLGTFLLKDHWSTLECQHGPCTVVEHLGDHLGSWLNVGTVQLFSLMGLGVGEAQGSSAAKRAQCWLSLGIERCF